jgi:hypothetical protein
LKRHACIPQTKRHANKLKKAEWSNNGCLGDVISCDWDLKIAFPQIQFAKHRAAVEAGYQVGHVGQRVLVLHRLEIKPAVIAARSPGTVFLPDHV